MEELFKSLVTGGRFQKRSKFSEEEKPAVAAANVSAPSLDFFGSVNASTTKESSAKKTKRKNSKEKKKTAPDSTTQRENGVIINGKKEKMKKKRQRKKKQKAVLENNLLENQKGKETQKNTNSEKEDEDSDSRPHLFLNQRHSISSKGKKKVSTKTGEETAREEEEARAFRRRLGIHARGGAGAPARPLATFADLPGGGGGGGNGGAAGAQQIRRVILENIEASDWVEPTPIQMQAIPTLLAGGDVLASAPTGSGKTAAFVIPTLMRLRAPLALGGGGGDGGKKGGGGGGGGGGPRALLLAPTRELAAQTLREVDRLGRGRKFRTVLLGKAQAATAAAQRGGGGGGGGAFAHVDVLVATPARLVGVLEKGLVDLSRVEMVCLDEVDKLFEQGKESKEDSAFIAQVDAILGACTHKGLVRAFFSATVDSRIQDLADAALVDPWAISVGRRNAAAATVDQKLVFVGREEGKLLAVRQRVQEGIKPPVLIFLQSKDRAKELYKELIFDGLNIDVIHADRTQEQRDAIIRRFRRGETWVLICTDLMARGIDFKGVNLVINYDFPQSAVSYIHRIGRTGRAGKKGEAITLFTEDDMDQLRSIANVMKLSGCDVPEWMLSIKKVGKRERKKRELSAPSRKRISTVSGYDLQRVNKRRLQHQGNSSSGPLNGKKKKQLKQDK